ncbi:MAG: polyprenyl synthetase family protein [Desulfobulbaceae bacterium]|nr:polyprenyl synthetase family protein [Desulfobulbaceae bacterium]
MNIKNYLLDQRKLVESALEKYMLEDDSVFSRHIEAMRYSLFAGGKRVRPILCLAAARAISDDKINIDTVLPIACALECIHTYSLIHDDLPAMDDDELRRGKPTNHTLFGEAQAILAGDGLLTHAFEILSDSAFSKIPDAARLRIIFTIAQAAGPQGMVGGQSLDIENEKQEITFETLQTIHRSKTGALITGSVLSGALAAGASEEQLESLTLYGNKIGLAFQIADDLLNVESTTEQLGKAAGSDAERGKATYPAFFGIAKTKTKANNVVSDAVDALKGFGPEATPLRELAKYIVNRTR